MPLTAVAESHQAIGFLSQASRQRVVKGQRGGLTNCVVFEVLPGSLR